MRMTQYLNLPLLGSLFVELDSANTPALDLWTEEDGSRVWQVGKLRAVFKRKRTQKHGTTPTNPRLKTFTTGNFSQGHRPFQDDAQ